MIQKLCGAARALVRFITHLPYYWEAVLSKPAEDPPFPAWEQKSWRIARIIRLTVRHIFQSRMFWLPHRSTACDMEGCQLVLQDYKLITLVPESDDILMLSPEAEGRLDSSGEVFLSYFENCSSQLDWRLVCVSIYLSVYLFICLSFYLSMYGLCQTNQIVGFCALCWH